MVRTPTSKQFLLLLDFPLDRAEIAVLSVGGEGQGNPEKAVTNDTIDDIADIRTIWVNHLSFNVMLYC